MSQTTSVEIETALLERLRRRRPGLTDRKLLESVVLLTLGRATLRTMQERNALTEDEAIALGVRYAKPDRLASADCELPDLDLVVRRQGHGWPFAPWLASPCQKMLEEGQGAASRRGNYLPTVGIDDRERPMLRYCLSEDRPESLLIGCDEGSSLRIAIRVSRGFDQPLVGDLAGCGELAVL